MEKERSLTGKVALITGASKGLGKALSLELGRRGARLVMVARDEAALSAAAAEVRRETGAVAVPLAFDVADKNATHVIAAMAAELGGEVDVLVHNASALGPTPMPLLFDLECEDLAHVLETNVVGPFRLTKAVAGSMALRERGTIVFLSSDAAVNAYPGWGAYGLSKAAADHMARTLAVELEAHGVRSFSVDPTDMDTEMHALALPDADRSTLARPEAIASVIADMIERPDRAKSGERLNAGSWSAV
jgi:NAD(P)-dependent dehydrogenase (short-subunit alcohol dehydrogenase family)